MPGLKKKKDKGIDNSVQEVKSMFRFTTREQQSKFDNWILLKYSFQKKNGLMNLWKSLYLKFSTTFRCLLRSALGHLSHGED